MTDDSPSATLVLDGHQVQTVLRRKIDEIVEYMWHHDNALKIDERSMNAGEHILDAIARNLAVALTGGE